MVAPCRGNTFTKEKNLRCLGANLKSKSLHTEDGENHIGEDGANPEDLGSRETLIPGLKNGDRGPYVNRDLAYEVKY